MLEVSEIAKEKLRETFRIVNTPEKGFRITLEDFGDKGPVMGITIDTRKEGDIISEQDEFKIIMAPYIYDIVNSYGVLNLDYMDDPKGFKLIVT